MTHDCDKTNTLKHILFRFHESSACTYVNVYLRKKYGTNISIFYILKVKVHKNNKIYF